VRPEEVIYDVHHPLNSRFIHLAIRCGAVVKEDLTGHSARVEYKNQSWTVTCGKSVFEVLLDLGRWIAWRSR